MKLAVVGSREGFTYTQVRRALIVIREITCIISGGARGVDSFAKRFAEEQGIRYVEYSADWDRYGQSAGFKRNVRIVQECDRLIAFWDGQSRGTAHSIELAKKANKLIAVIYR